MNEITTLGVLGAGTMGAGIAQVAAFLGLLLAFGGLAVFVDFFLDETGGFLGFAFDAHDRLLVDVCHCRS